MTKKLLVTIALGVALAIIGAGTAASITVGAGDVTTTVPSQDPIPQCSDLMDNDGDGLVDMNDPGCGSPLDDSEYNPASSADSGGGGASSGGGSGGSSVGSGLSAAGGSGGSRSGGTVKVNNKPNKKGGPAKGLFGRQAKKKQKGGGAAEPL